MEMTALVWGVVGTSQFHSAAVFQREDPLKGGH